MVAAEPDGTLSLLERGSLLVAMELSDWPGKVGSN